MSPNSPPSLTNPPVRREIRPDFPCTISAGDAKEIFEVLERELEKYGTSLSEVGHITLVYPHKHPELFPAHYDKAKETVDTFMKTVLGADNPPAIDWLTADGLVETKHLSRSENRTSLYALMVRQIYDMHTPSQITPLPFLDQQKNGKEFVVIIDWSTEQGTTVANMMSYIEHNGGTVLAAAVDPGYSGRSIAQNGSSSGLSPRFDNAVRNTGRLKLLGTLLSRNAGQEGLDLSPEQCLDLFEKGLNKNGMSVYAMTEGEGEKLAVEMHGGLSSFSLFMKELGVDLPPSGKPREFKRLLPSKPPAPTA